MTAEDDARALWAQAQEAFGREDWQHAVDLFAEMMLSPGVEAHVATHELQWNMGVCYAHLGQTDLARQHFQAGGYSESSYQETLDQIAAAHH